MSPDPEPLLNTRPDDDAEELHNTETSTLDSLLSGNHLKLNKDDLISNLCD